MLSYSSSFTISGQTRACFWCVAYMNKTEINDFWVEYWVHHDARRLVSCPSCEFTTLKRQHQLQFAPSGCYSEDSSMWSLSHFKEEAQRKEQTSSSHFLWLMHCEMSISFSWSFNQIISEVATINRNSEKKDGDDVNKSSFFLKMGVEWKTIFSLYFPKTGRHSFML